MNRKFYMPRRLLLIFVLGISSVFINSCRSPKTIDSKQQVNIQDSVEKKLSDTENNKALLLLQRNCFTCHNPDMPSGNRVAPPMFKLREHYYTEGETRENFIRRIIRYVNNPSEELSIMPGAVRNFGVMPKLSYNQDDLTLIASYMYENDLSSENWYAEWEAFKKRPQKDETETSYEELGKHIANGTKSELGKNLLNAINEKGTPDAVVFCNIKAIPLTDSMAIHYKAKVKRVSDKPRNPNNKANDEELAYIEQLKEANAKGEKMPPLITDKGDKVIGYYAIETNKMCLQCHGQQDKDILPATWSNIKNLYPSDKAFGYGENQVRGIFVVEMNK